MGVTMADVKEIAQQIAELTELLGRELDGVLEARQVDDEAQIARLSAELEQTRADKDAAQVARQEAEREADVAEKRVESLVQKLKEARQATIEAGEEAQRTLRRQLEALQGECDDARAELDNERSVRKRLERGAAADEKRLQELEKALATANVPAGTDSAELATVQGALDEARDAATKERQEREKLALELASTGKKLAALERQLSRAESASADTAADGAQVREQLAALTEKLKTTESELAAEQQLCRRYATECAEAQRRLSELESRGGMPAETGLPLADKPLLGSKPATDKPLPHELRPAPKPGALFRPDWDLNVLPCSSTEQILQAWASVSNVQLSLEGYPSQYCSAYLVIVKQGKQKQLYMLFNLKGIKHILVCVPSTPPKDEASLNKLAGEGQKYLLMSGFDLEKLPAADIPKRLGHYLQG